MSRGLRTLLAMSTALGVPLGGMFDRHAAKEQRMPNQHDMERIWRAEEKRARRAVKRAMAVVPK